MSKFGAMVMGPAGAGKVRYKPVILHHFSRPGWDNTAHAHSQLRALFHLRAMTQLLAITQLRQTAC